MKKRKNVMFFLGFALICLVVVSVMVGRMAITWDDLTEIIAARLENRQCSAESAETVLLQSRLPRIAAAMLIGCGLSVSGAGYQGIFRNPMVSPDLLGASAGAGFGAALGLLLGVPTFIMQCMAFCSGIAAVLLTGMISRAVGGHMENNRLLLVLSGIVVGSLFKAFISIIKYVADPFDTMPSIAFWLMGGLTYVTVSDMLFLFIPVAAGTIVLMMLRWRLNLLSFGTDEAEAMGVPVKKYQGIVILCATFMTAACVAVGGMIGWVGLIIPHFARLIAGSDYKKMLPCSAVLGALFLLLVDDVARCAFPQELPIGILTAIVGAPVFIILLAKGRKGFL